MVPAAVVAGCSVVAFTWASASVTLFWVGLVAVTEEDGITTFTALVALYLLLAPVPEAPGFPPLLTNAVVFTLVLTPGLGFAVGLELMSVVRRLGIGLLPALDVVADAAASAGYPVDELAVVVEIVPLAVVCVDVIVGLEVEVYEEAEVDDGGGEDVLDELAKAADTSV